MGSRVVHFVADAPIKAGWSPCKRPKRCAAPAKPTASRGSGAPTDRSSSSSSAQPGPLQQAPEALTRRAAALTLSAAIAASAVLAAPSAAVTQEQLLFLEAWRAVDRAYVDKKFNGQNWFKVNRSSLAGC